MSAEQDIKAALEAWAEQESKSGEWVPDFWSELCAAERIAAYLAEQGFRKIQ